MYAVYAFHFLVCHYLYLHGTNTYSRPPSLALGEGTLSYTTCAILLILQLTCVEEACDHHLHVTEMQDALNCRFVALRSI